MKKVLSLPPPSHLDLMFRPTTWEALKNEFDVLENHQERQLSPAEVIAEIGDCDAVLTGWSSPSFSQETLDAAPNLKLVAHTAGSVKCLFSEALVREVLIPRGLTIYSGNGAMAINVAEATLGLMILASRRWFEHAEQFRRTRQGTELPINGRFLTGATVGLVSASAVAREVLRLLPLFDCEILLCDPFVSPEAARELGAELVELNELFRRSDIVSVHAPALPTTQNLIGASQLALLRDGATFLNTARGAVVDHDALLRECCSGRIVAALDVTEPEPLSPDSPFWELPNVVLLPHLAGRGEAGLFQIGDGTLQALRATFAGNPVQGAVSLEHWQTLA